MLCISLSLSLSLNFKSPILCVSGPLSIHLSMPTLSPSQIQVPNSLSIWPSIYPSIHPSTYSSISRVLVLPRLAVKGGTPGVPAICGNSSTCRQLSQAVQQVILMHCHLQEWHNLVMQHSISSIAPLIEYSLV